MSTIAVVVGIVFLTILFFAVAVHFLLRRDPQQSQKDQIERQKQKATCRQNVRLNNPAAFKLEGELWFDAGQDRA
jgi:hypothetical protein